MKKKIVPFFDNVIYLQTPLNVDSINILKTDKD